MSLPTRLAISVLAVSAAFVALAAATRVPAPAVAPEPARIATCDVYALMELMMQGEPYKPAQDAEQARLQSDLMPLKLELEKLEKELQAARPDDLVAQDKYRTYQSKGEEFRKKSQAASESYGVFVVGQYSEAYQKVLAEARKTATTVGYTHVFSVKRGEIKAKNPQQLVEEFLSRPVAIAPAEADITEAVRVAMKLPDKPAGPSSDKPASAPATPEKPPAPDQPKP